MSKKVGGFDLAVVIGIFVGLAAGLFAFFRLDAFAALWGGGAVGTVVGIFQITFRLFLAYLLSAIAQDLLQYPMWIKHLVSGVFIFILLVSTNLFLFLSPFWDFMVLLFSTLVLNKIPWDALSPFKKVQEKDEKKN